MSTAGLGLVIADWPCRRYWRRIRVGSQAREHTISSPRQGSNPSIESPRGIDLGRRKCILRERNLSTST